MVFPRTRRAIRPDAGNWLPHPPHGNRALRPWLTEAGSLTVRLRNHAPKDMTFRVRVLRQGKARPHRDEAALLGWDHHRLCLVRDVVLAFNDQAVVFAHTLIPLGRHHHPWRWLDRIGHKPLGAVLFTHGGIRPGPHAYRRLDQRHPLHRAARAWCPATTAPRHLSARRAAFTLAGSSLVVTEVFLPSLLEICAP